MLSSSRVRDVDGGWIPVIGNGNRDEGGKIHRARLRSGDETIFTLFIDNLPEDVSHSWLKKLFSNYGVVIDAFIPEKRSKVTGRKFGFIRYNCSISAEVAISKVNGLWCGDKKLFVKHASFNQNQQRQSTGENVRLNNNVGIGASYRNGQDREVKSSSHCENYFQGAVGCQTTAFKSTGGFKSFAQILKGDNCEIVEKSHEKATLNIIPILEDQNFISQVWEEKMDVRSPDISSASSDSKDTDSLVEESPVGKAENIKQCPPKDIALGEDDDHMDNSKTKDDDKLVTVDDEDSIENVNCEEAAVSENSDCDAVDCSIANGVGNIDDGSQPNFTNGIVANSKHSNSIVVEDPVLAVTNKDKEILMAPEDREKTNFTTEWGTY
ncbi:hypothetical protein Vadar_018880 [Vaccinium darrowii]|uniref:Uncharacterized protein n=1 Tax=Vaccinium darrowii TaxID=229202 RepID=A0ACB7X1V4_9ERIC|nr:hypothetical protein Vadar_018880 [Vaccinium darrowii]